jgi:TP901 family phage tail tape measure protein
MIETTDTITIKIKVKDDGSVVVSNFTQKIKHETKEIKSSFEKAAEGITGFIKKSAAIAGITMTFAGLGAAVRGVTADVISFNTEFTQVENITDATQVNIRELEQGILSMGGALGEVTELTKGTYQVISSMQKPKTALEDLTAAAKFAQGGQTSLNETVLAGTGIVNAFGESAGGLTHVYDVLWQTIKDGVTTAPELATAIGRVTGVAKEAGLSVEEMSSSIAVMTQISGNTNETVTALRGILSEVIKPSKEAGEEADKLGINFSKAGIAAMGFGNWLQDVMTKIRTGDGDVAKLWGRVDALNGIFQLTRNNMSNFNSEMQNMTNVTGNNEAAFERYKESFKGAWETVKNEVQAIFVKTLLPLLKEAAGWFNENKDKISDFARDLVSGIRTAIVVIADLKDVIILAGKAIAVSFAVSKLTPFFSTLRTGFANLKEYYGVLRLEGKTAFAAMSGSIKEAGVSAKGLTAQIKAIPTSIKIGIAYVGLELFDNFVKLIEAKTGLKYISNNEFLGKFKYIIDFAPGLQGMSTANSYINNKLAKTKEEISAVFSEISVKTKVAETDLVRLQEAFDLKFTGAGQLKSDLSSLAGFMTDLREKSKLSKDQVSALLSKIDDMNLDFRKDREQIDLLVKGFVDLNSKGKQIDSFFKTVGNIGGIMQKEVTGFIDTLKKLKKEQEEATGPTQEQTKAFQALAKEVGVLTQEGLKDLDLKIYALSKSFDLGRDTIYKNKEGFEKLREGIDILVKTYKNAEKDIPPALQKLNKETTDLAVSSGAFLEYLPKVSKNYMKLIPSLKDTTEASKAVKDSFEKTTYAIKKKHQEIDTLSEKIGNAIGVMNSFIGALVDLGYVSSETGSALAGVANSVGQFAEGIITKNPAGIIGGIVGAVSSIFDLFKKERDWAGEARAALSGLEGVTQDMRDRLAELAEEIGSTQRAYRELMSEFIESGVNSEGTFNQWAQQVLTLFSHIGNITQDTGTGDFVSREGVDNLDAAFAALVEKADQFKMHGSAAMLEIIQRAKELGEVVPSVTAYIDEQLKTTLDGLKSYVKSMQGTYEFNAEFLNTSITSIFAAMRAEGYSYVDIVTEMGDSLRELAAKAEKEGSAISGAIADMVNLAGFVEQNKTLIENIDATRAMMEGLGNTGYLTGQSFDEFLKKTVLNFGLLTEAGASETDALRILAPQLEDLITYAESYGYAIDDNTQSLIDRARAEGVLNEQSMTDSEKTVSLLEEIVTLLGGEIPYALQQTTTEVGTSVDQITTDTGVWSDQLSTIKTQMGDLETGVTDLEETYHEKMVGNTIVTDTEKWKDSLVNVEGVIYKLIDKVKILDDTYYVIQDAAGATEDFYLYANGLVSTLYKITDQVDILGTQFWVLQDCADTSETWYLWSDGILRNLKDTLALQGELTWQDIGSRYGVYTPDEMNAMTAQYYQLAALWENANSIITGDPAAMARFLADLEALSGGIIDESNEQYQAFVESIRWWNERIQAGYTYDDEAGWTPPPVDPYANYTSEFFGKKYLEIDIPSISAEMQEMAAAAATSLSGMNINSDSFANSLTQIANQFGITIPDTLTTMQQKYNFVMSTLTGSTDNLYLSTNNVLLTLKEIISQQAKATYTDIGSNYGVYTDDQKNSMTMRFRQMGYLWQASRDTILSSPANMARFLSDLEGLKGGINDDTLDQYNTFVSAIRQWNEHLKRGETWNGSGWDKPPQAALGGTFIVPPGYPSTMPGMNIGVHSGELVQVYTASETADILRTGVIPGSRIDGKSLFDDAFDDYNDSTPTPKPGGLNFPFSSNSKVSPVPAGEGNAEPIKIEVNVLFNPVFNITPDEGIDTDEFAEKINAVVEDNVKNVANTLAEEIARRLKK